MSTLREHLAQVNEKAAVYAAKHAEGTLTSEEAQEFTELVAKAATTSEQIKQADEALRKLGGLKESDKPAVTVKTAEEARGTRTLGEHAVKELADDLMRFKSTSGRYSAASSEFKAATDVHAIVTPTLEGGVPPEYEQTVVRDYRVAPTIANWIGNGTMSSTTLIYFVELPREGQFETVAELGYKPRMNYSYTTRTDSLTKMAGHIKVSDEMIDDLPFIMSEINGRLTYDLAMDEEAQLLNGNGQGTDLEGLLNRSGIQTANATDAQDNLDAVFRGLMSVKTMSGLTPDGIVINPTDYQAMRLSKNSQGDYYAGGPFSGFSEPPLWGTRTIVTPAIPEGTVLLGSGKQSATVYRKGGVSVEATNTNENDFVKNIVTIRAEQRLGLAVRRPLGLLKLSLGATNTP